MMPRAFIAALAITITGCATDQALLATYQPPESCSAINAEMAHIARRDAHIVNAFGLKDGLVVGVGVAAAAGMVPAGWAWGPLAATVAGQLRAPTQPERLAYLANARESRGCVVRAKTEP